MKRKALFLTGIILVACVAVAGSQFKDNNPILNSNSQNPISNFDNSNKAVIQDSSNSEESPNNNQKSDVNQDTPQTNIQNPDSKSIASKYIEEPGAVAGEPKRIKIGGKQTDVVPVIQNGKQVGEIHIDPKTGENVGGAGGAP